MSNEEQQQFLRKPLSPRLAGAYSMITVNINGVQKTMLVPSLSASVVRTAVQSTVKKTAVIRNSSRTLLPTATSLHPTSAHSLSNVSLNDTRLKQLWQAQVSSPRSCTTVHVVSTIQSSPCNTTSILIDRNRLLTPRALSTVINRDSLSTNPQIIVMPPSSASTSSATTLPPPGTPSLRVSLNPGDPRPMMLFGPRQVSPGIQTFPGLSRTRPINATSMGIRNATPKEIMNNFGTQISPRVVPMLYKGYPSALLQWFVSNKPNALTHNKIIEIVPETDATQVKQEQEVKQDVCNESRDVTSMLTSMSENSQGTAEMQHTTSVSDKRADLPQFMITDVRSMQSKICKQASNTNSCGKVTISPWDANLLDVLGIHTENDLESADYSQSSRSIDFTRNDSRSDSETDTATSDIGDSFNRCDTFNYSVPVTSTVVSVPKRRKRRRLCEYSVQTRRKKVISSPSDIGHSLNPYDTFDTDKSVQAISENVTSAVVYVPKCRKRRRLCEYSVRKRRKKPAISATSDINYSFDPSDTFVNSVPVIRENVTSAVVIVPKRQKRRRFCEYSVHKRRKKQAAFPCTKRSNSKASVEAIDASKVFNAKRTGSQRPEPGGRTGSNDWWSVPVDSKLANGCFTYVERILLKCDSINIKRNMKNIFCCINGIVNKAFFQESNSVGSGMKRIAGKQEIANYKLLPVSKKLSKRRTSFAVAHCTDSTLRISNVLSLKDLTDSDVKSEESNVNDKNIEYDFDEENARAQLAEGESDVEKTNASNALSSSPMRTVYVQSQTRPNSPVPMLMSTSKLPPDLPEDTKFMLIKTTHGTFIMPMELDSKTVIASEARNSVSTGTSKLASSRHITGTLRNTPFQDRSVSTPPTSVAELLTSDKTIKQNWLSQESPTSCITEIFSSKMIANQSEVKHEIVDVETLDSDESSSVIGSISNASLNWNDDSCKPSHRDRINRLKEAMMRQEQQLDALRKQRI